MVCQDTLRIKHLPKELSDAQKEDFMRHFGAVKVKVITSKAKAKSVVFAKFPNTDVAKNVMTRLHQLNVLNCRLSVEYAETDILQGAPSVKKITDLKELPDQKFFKNFINNINAFNDSVGFHQPPPSHLKYNYPKANRSTINNIAHALATVPRFYTQVLHLMNKMNLPPPFAMPEPPVRVIQPFQNPVPQKPAENPPEKRKESSSESEIESDGESNKITNIIPQKRKLPQKKVVKRPKFIKQNVAPTNVSTKPPDRPENIFEKVEVQIPKKIELRVMPELPPEPQKVEPTLEQVLQKSPEPKIKLSVEPKLVESKYAQSSKPEVNKKSIIKPEIKPKLQQILAPKKDIPLVSTRVSTPPAKKIVDSVSEEDKEIELLKQKVIESMSTKKSDETVKDKLTIPPAIIMPNKNILTRKLTEVEEEKKSEKIVIEKSSQVAVQAVLSSKDLGKSIHIGADVKVQEIQQKQDKPQELRQEHKAPEQDFKTVLQPSQKILLQKQDKPQELRQERKAPEPDFKTVLQPSQKVDQTVIESNNDLLEPTSPDDEYPCISLEELAANQVTDLSVMPVFKNYTPGEPTNKLYIKNCAKTVVVQDLEYIYNRYREDPTEDKTSEFNIRLMQEGRMKGQAFVTLDSIKMAEKAVKETNGFILKDKPLVVVFGKAGKKKK